MAESVAASRGALPIYWWTFWREVQQRRRQCSMVLDTKMMTAVEKEVVAVEHLIDTTIWTAKVGG